MISNASRVESLLAEGRVQQVMDETLGWLKAQPDNLFAIESMLKAQWRAGDLKGALQWVERALTLNPKEPGYHFLRGMLRQSVGMVDEAVEDLLQALNMTKPGQLREQVALALEALEDWQFSVIATLLNEDRSFRIQFFRNPVDASRLRGFRFSAESEKMLPLMKETTQPTYGGYGIC